MEIKDIHNSKTKVSRSLDIIKQNNKISKNNKKIIKKIYEECVSIGLSYARINIYLVSLNRLATDFCNKDFDKLTKDDIKKLVAKIETNDKWSDSTKARYKIIVRKLIQVLEGYDWNSKKYPDKVDWISVSMKNNNHKLPEEILTKEDIKKMINSASSIRDRAFISVLYESGCRIGELLTLKLKNVIFDEYGAIINVFGKTGSRRIRLISCVPELSQLIENHTFKNDNESYLWIDQYQNPLGYPATRKILKKIAKKSNIQKPVNPHAFRHARATHLANHLTEAQMKEYFGWTQASKMASIYVHLSGRDVDDAILKLHGKKIQENKQDEIQTKTCIRCNEINSFDTKYCKKCGTILNQQDAMKVMDLEKNILNLIDSEILEKLIENKIKEMLNRRN